MSTWPPTTRPRRARRAGARERLVHSLILDRADIEAQRRGQSRRDFLRSSAGTATALAMIEWVNGCSGRRLDGAASPPDPGEVETSQHAAGSSAPTTERGPATVGAGVDASTPTGANAASDAGAQDADAASGAPDCVIDVDDPSFVFDIQTRLIVRPQNSTGFDIEFWLPPYDERHPWIERPAGCTGYDCVDQAAYAEQVLAGGDTSVSTLAGMPYQLGPTGEGAENSRAVTNEQVRRAADALIERFPGRVLTQASIMPNDRIDLQLAVMERIAPQFDHWRIEPGWSPQGVGGLWLTDDDGRRVLQAGLDLGAPIFCISKGMPQGFDSAYADPGDIGEAALAFPDAHLVVLHAAFDYGFGAGQSSRPDPDDPNADHGWGPGVGRFPEGPYDEDDAATQSRYPLDRGVNALISTLRRAGIGPNGTALSGSTAPRTHVYVDCSAAWAELMVGRAHEAMHYFGKLLVHVGEDRILWGTDSPLYGNPQVLIAAFRAFEISPEFQATYGYPALDDERKRKILGINAARLQAARDAARLPSGVECTLARARTLSAAHPARDLLTTRRQLLRLPGRA